MSAIIEIRYFNSFVLKKVVNSGNNPVWNGSYGIPGYNPDETGVSTLNNGIITPQTNNETRNWVIEESRIRGGYNNTFTTSGPRAYFVEEEPNARFRGHALIYSGIFNSTTGINQSNVFSVGVPITRSLDPAKGTIQKLYAEDYYLNIFQEDKISRAPINKNIIYSAEGNPTVTTSNMVIGDPIAYKGDFGISRNPESFAKYGFRKYFTDKDRNAVMRLSADGLEEIQRYGMYDFFRDKLSALDSPYGTGRAIGMWDIHTKQYVVSLQPNQPYTLGPLGETVNRDYYTVSFDESVKGWTSFYDYKPALGTSLKNVFYTFNNGSSSSKKAELYKHNSEFVNRSNFYGVQYKAKIKFIFNPDVSASKVFKTINYEGSNGWQVDSVVSDKTGIGSIDTGWETTSTGQNFDKSNTEDSIVQIYSYNEGAYDNFGNQFPSLMTPPINRAGFDRKENKYFANLVNSSAATTGEVRFGNKLTGIKGYFTTVTISTDTNTDPGGMKEIYAVSSQYNISSY